MRLQAPWRKLDDGRLTQFQNTLLAAQATRGYREPLRIAGLDSPRAVRRLRSIEHGLRRLPLVPYEQLRANPEDFQNPLGSSCEPLRLICPPGMFTAPLETLLARASVRNYSGAHHGVIVLINFDAGGMPERTREFLWHAFEVPLFEQWIGPDGTVLATECEAHEGMHVLEDSAIVELGTESQVIVTSLTSRRHPLLRLVTGFTGTLLTESCACGQSGPRLVVSKQAISERSLNAFAASTT